MKHFKLLALAAITALACSGAAVAGPQWTFANVGFANGDGDEDFDTKFVGFEGCMGFADMWHVRGELASGETAENVGLDVDILQFGVGFHRSISDNTDVSIDVFFGTIDETQPLGFSIESDYMGYSFGVRSMLTEQFEFNASVNYADVDCPAAAACGIGDIGLSAVDVGGQIGGRYLFDKAMSVGAGLNFNGVRGDVLTVDFRWAFGDFF